MTDTINQSPVVEQATTTPVRIASTGQADAAQGGDVDGDIDMELLESTLDYIRPAIQMDGGDIILQGVEDGVVNLQMVGACGGCPLSMMTLKAGIERILTDRVPGVRSVNAEA